MLKSLRRELTDKLAFMLGFMAFTLVMFESDNVAPNIVLGVKKQGVKGGLVIVNLNDQFNLMRTRLLISTFDWLLLVALEAMNIFDNEGYAFAELVIGGLDQDDLVRITLPDDQVLFWNLTNHAFNA